MKPSDVLGQFSRKEIMLMPPQFYILTTLAGILGKECREQSRSRIHQLSAGHFGHARFNPVALRHKDEQGRTILTYENDETRGGPKGRQHRSLVTFGAGGVSDSAHSVYKKLSPFEGFKRSHIATEFRHLHRVSGPVTKYIVRCQAVTSLR
jgi:hypothetical protein